jgi:hypothetical protein
MLVTGVMDGKSDAASDLLKVLGKPGRDGPSPEPGPGMETKRLSPAGRTADRNGLEDETDDALPGR